MSAKNAVTKFDGLIVFATEGDGKPSRLEESLFVLLRTRLMEEASGLGPVKGPAQAHPEEGRMLTRIQLPSAPSGGGGGRTRGAADPVRDILAAELRLPSQLITDDPRDSNLRSGPHPTPPPRRFLVDTHKLWTLPSPQLPGGHQDTVDAPPFVARKKTKPAQSAGQTDLHRGQPCRELPSDVAQPTADPVESLVASAISAWGSEVSFTGEKEAGGANSPDAIVAVLRETDLALVCDGAQLKSGRFDALRPLLLLACERQGDNARTEESAQTDGMKEEPRVPFQLLQMFPHVDRNASTQRIASPRKRTMRVGAAFVLCSLHFHTWCNVCDFLLPSAGDNMALARGAVACQDAMGAVLSDAVRRVSHNDSNEEGINVGHLWSLAKEHLRRFLAAEKGVAGAAQGAAIVDEGAPHKDLFDDSDAADGSDAKAAESTKRSTEAWISMTLADVLNALPTDLVRNPQGSSLQSLAVLFDHAFLQSEADAQTPTLVPELELAATKPPDMYGSSPTRDQTRGTGHGRQVATGPCHRTFSLICADRKEQLASKILGLLNARLLHAGTPCEHAASHRILADLYSWRAEALGGPQHLCAKGTASVRKRGRMGNVPPVDRAAFPPDFSEKCVSLFLEAPSMPLEYYQRELDAAGGSEKGLTEHSEKGSPEAAAELCDLAEVMCVPAFSDMLPATNERATRSSCEANLLVPRTEHALQEYVTRLASACFSPRGADSPGTPQLKKVRRAAGDSLSRPGDGGAPCDGVRSPSEGFTATDVDSVGAVEPENLAGTARRYRQQLVNVIVRRHRGSIRHILLHTTSHPLRMPDELGVAHDTGTGQPVNMDTPETLCRLLRQLWERVADRVNRVLLLQRSEGTFRSSVATREETRSETEETALQHDDAVPDPGRTSPQPTGDADGTVGSPPLVPTTTTTAGNEEAAAAEAWEAYFKPMNPQEAMCLYIEGRRFQGEVTEGDEAAVSKAVLPETVLSRALGTRSGPTGQEKPSLAGKRMQGPWPSPHDMLFLLSFGASSTRGMWGTPTVWDKTGHSLPSDFMKAELQALLQALEKKGDGKPNTRAGESATLHASVKAKATPAFMTSVRLSSPWVAPSSTLPLSLRREVALLDAIDVLRHALDESLAAVHICMWRRVCRASQLDRL